MKTLPKHVAHLIGVVNFERPCETRNENVNDETTPPRHSHLVEQRSIHEPMKQLLTGMGGTGATFLLGITKARNFGISAFRIFQKKNTAPNPSPLLLSSR